MIPSAGTSKNTEKCGGLPPPSQIESEKARYNFSVETFCKIAQALEVTLDQLAAPAEEP